MFHLDRRSSIPLHFQIKEQLVRRIESGELAVGKPFPTEMELVDLYAVSRSTVRQALLGLEHDGYVERTPGRGTLVIRAKLSRGLTRLTSFTEEMQRRGLHVTARVLDFQEDMQAPAITERMGIKRNRPLLYVYRLRCINEEPVALNISYLNLPEGITISRSELEQVGSIYALLERKNLPPLESDKTLEATAADEEQARLLNMPIGAPLLLVEGVVYTLNHRPLEFHQVVNCGERYKYTLHLER